MGQLSTFSPMSKDINTTLSTIFQNLAYALAVEDEKKNHFRIVAYENGARVIRNLPEPVTNLIKDDELPKIPGIGKAMAEKIISYLANGHIATYDAILEIYPETFFDILRIPHVGPKTAKLLFEEYHVKSLPDLEKVLSTDELANHEGFGEKSLTNLREAMTRIKKNTSRSPITEVLPVVHDMLTYLKASNYCIQACVGGSVRRYEETIGDADILTTSEHADELITYFVNYPQKTLVQAQGPTKASILVGNNLQIDLRVVPEESFGAALQYFTGSKEHNVVLRNIAKDKGYKLNEYGVFEGEKNIASRTEADIYQSLGLHYIPPELRRNDGEIEEAAQNDFSYLVTKADIEASNLCNQSGEAIPPELWDNYPVLVTRVQKAKSDKLPLVITITQHVPPVQMWTILAREKMPVIVKSNSLEPWQKDLLLGTMRRSRVTNQQVVKA